MCATNTQPAIICCTSAATVENVGADFTIASVMPVSAWIAGGIGTSGSTSVLHSVTQGAAPAAFDVKGMPTSYLIDRQGVVVAVEEGFHEERAAALEARIRTLLDRQ